MTDVGGGGTADLNRKGRGMTATEAYVNGSSFGETVDRYPKDQLLRRYGFKIHSRPAKGPVLWKREANIFTEELALVIAERQEMEREAHEAAEKRLD